MIDASSTAAPDREPTALTISGAANAAIAGWGQLRAGRWWRLVTAMKVTGPLAAALIAAWLFRDVMPTPAIIVWAVTLGAVLAFSAQGDLTMRHIFARKHDSWLARYDTLTVTCPPKSPSI